MRKQGRPAVKRLRSSLRFGILPCVTAILVTLAGCARHRSAGPQATAAVAPTPAVYPPVSPAAVEILNRFPTGAYDKLGTVTVQESAAIPLDRTVAAVREKAGQAGANAMVLLQQRQFTQRNEFTHRRTPTRFTVFVLLRRGVPMSRVVPLGPSKHPGPPPPPPMGSSSGGSGTH